MLHCIYPFMSERIPSHGATHSKPSSSITGSMMHSGNAHLDQDVSNIISKLTIGAIGPRPSRNVFSALDPSEYILLLTPYLEVPPPHLARLTMQMDPFEPFGRELANHHANIRHVPYVPKYGMMELHESLLEDAGAVILVVCEPPEFEGRSPKDRVDRLEEQQLFAKAVIECLDDEVPNALISIKTETFSDDFELAIKVASWEKLTDATAELFGEMGCLAIPNLCT